MENYNVPMRVGECGKSVHETTLSIRFTSISRCVDDSNSTYPSWKSFVATTTGFVRSVGTWTFLELGSSFYTAT